MNETMNKRAVGVGLFIFIGLLFLLGGILTIGNLHSTFSKKMTISSIFGDVNGLVAGNNIWFSGVKIGTVKKTEFYGKSQVKVVMNINTESKQYIRKDAKIKISTDGLIGNKILVIYGGTSFAPAVEQGDTLANEMMLSTEDIMKTFQENNQNILAITKKLKDGEGTVGKLLSNDSLYKSLAITTNSLRLAAAKTQDVVLSLANFGDKLNKKNGLANNIATDTVVFHSIKKAVVQLQHTANSFSTKLNKKGTSINAFITDTLVFNSLKTSIFHLQSIADSAAYVVNNLKFVASNLKDASNNPKSPVGVLLHDEQAGANVKTIITNLESSSKKLDKDLEALQHNFLLRGFFKKEAKKKAK